MKNAAWATTGKMCKKKIKTSLLFYILFQLIFILMQLKIFFMVSNVINYNNPDVHHNIEKNICFY